MKILIVAGEASGDLHGGNLARAIFSIDKNFELYGIGGRVMREAGVNLFFDIKDMGIVGLDEVFGKIFLLKKVYSMLCSCIRENIYDAVILIDYPTMNLRLAKIARKKNIPVFYYISPQIWAWRRGRVKQIKKDVTKMIVILPFEEKFYSGSGVDVSFVGHPFVDIVKLSMSKAETIDKMEIIKDKKVITFFPGSRNNELNMLLPLMLSSASLIKKNNPNVQFLLVLAETIDRRPVEKMIERFFIDVKIIEGNNYNVMSISDLLIVASGSVTLEASFFAVPMVIVYKVSLITYFLGRMLINISNIGLVNIIAEEKIVPELVQYDANPKNITSVTLKILNDDKIYSYMKKKVQEVNLKLGGKGACIRAAKIIIDYLKK